MAKQIILTIGGTDISFKPEMARYNKYINEMSMDNKVAPTVNYLNAVVVDEDKAKLKEILAIPGAAIQVAGQLNDEFAPKLEMTVKK